MLLTITEHPRSWVPVLCVFRDTTHFDETEPECVPSPEGCTLLVHACRQPKGVPERQSEQVDGVGDPGAITSQEPAADTVCIHQTKAPEGTSVGLFGTLHRQKRLGQQGIHPRHRRESERDILQGLRPWCAVRDTDARWPSLRELARIVLREEDPVLCLPAPFCDDARVMLRDLTEHDATRIHVPVVVEGPPSVKVDGVMLGQLGGQEPTFAVVWVPGSDKDCVPWLEMIHRLSEAGYPGCLGCGGPDALEAWDERHARHRMRKGWKED